jgi:hypothetical protein
MKRLYQWLGQRASALFSAGSVPDMGRTVRTEVTVQECTTVVMGAVLLASDSCPLCGGKLTPGHVKPARLFLAENSGSRAVLPGENSLPAIETENRTDDFETQS